MNRRDSPRREPAVFCCDLLGNDCHCKGLFLHCPTVASLYQRKKSPYWWIEYIDAAGERRQKSTKYRRDGALETRKANQLRDDLTTREIAAKQHASLNGGPEIWPAWVPRLIKQRYGPRRPNSSRDRADAAWFNVEAYLRSESISVPRQLTRQHIRDFIEWRQVAHRELGVRKGAKNTALLEVKFLGVFMSEAVESGFCSGNPCLRLGIGRDEPKMKPKISSAEHRLIVRKLKREPEWMRIAYAIAWEQGCRISETHLRLPGPSRTGGDVDLARNVLRLRTKGKKERVAEVPLSPKLRPLFVGLIRQKRETTYEMPKSGAKTFWTFFRKIGLGHLSIHSTRVSFITRCYEDAELSEEDAMRLALHASTTIHRIYPRLPAASRHLQQAMKRVSRSGTAKRAA